MKKLSLLVATAFLFIACSNNDANGEMHHHEMNVADSNKVAKGPIDPVCDMVKGDDWTEFSVTNKDTTWFCSPHCKKTFDKNPKKYTKK